MDAVAFEGAFADPTRASQRVFRAVLGAMAEPGTVHALPPLAAAPAPLSPAMAAVALTLCDAETPVFLAEAFAGPAAAWLTFHTDAPVTTERAAARFAFLDSVDLDGFPLGDEAYPDRSATLVVECALAGTAFTLAGPGIDGTRAFAAAFDPAFGDRWAVNRALFPCGLDLVLTDGDRLAALPRTTEVACTSR